VPADAVCIIDAMLIGAGMDRIASGTVEVLTDLVSPTRCRGPHDEQPDSRVDDRP